MDLITENGVRNTVVENMMYMGLDPDEFKDFIEYAVKTKIISLYEDQAPGSEALIEYYY